MDEKILGGKLNRALFFQITKATPAKKRETYSFLGIRSLLGIHQDITSCIDVGNSCRLKASIMQLQMYCAKTHLKKR